MMRTLKYTAALAAVALFAACTRDDMEEETPLPPGSDMPICWNVDDVASSANATRVMIGKETGSRHTNPADPDFFITLPEVCEVPEDDPKRENGFAIGLFSDYTYEESGQTVTVNDLYRGARLVFLPEVVVNEKVLSQWDTNVGLKYWHPGAKYIFRAYYPQRLHGYTVSTSNATTLALVYPSRKLQYDLLLGVNEVTATEVDIDPETGKTIKGQMHRPVELQLKHALAALRFHFRLNFEDADFLTSVYLLNDEKRHYFSQGTVVFGDAIDKDADKTDADIKKKRESIEWLQDYNPPADELLYKWVPPLKYWYGKDEDKDGVFEELSAEEMLAEWGWDNENDKPKDGLPEDFPDALSDDLVNSFSSPFFSSGNKKFNPVLMYSTAKASTPSTGDISGNDIEYKSKYANAYYGTEQYYDLVTDNKWKECNSDYVASEGALYCRNSGWLLIPPQESFGTLTLCFTTKKGGGTLYKVKLPQMTGTRLKDGTVASFSVKDAVENPALLPDGTDVWAAGKRYTYVVTISESNLTIDVSIKDWNERKHSTEIIF